MVTLNSINNIIWLRWKQERQVRPFGPEKVSREVGRQIAVYDVYWQFEFGNRYLSVHWILNSNRWSPRCGGTHHLDKFQYFYKIVGMISGPGLYPIQHDCGSGPTFGLTLFRAWSPAHFYSMDYYKFRKERHSLYQYLQRKCTHFRN